RILRVVDLQARIKTHAEIRFDASANIDRRGDSFKLLDAQCCLCLALCSCLHVKEAFLNTDNLPNTTRQATKRDFAIGSLISPEHLITPTHNKATLGIVGLCEAQCGNSTRDQGVLKFAVNRAIKDAYLTRSHKNALNVGVVTNRNAERINANIAG